MKIQPSDRISTAAAAELLGISQSAIKGWIFRDAVDHEKVGRDNYVSRRQFQKFKEKPETWPVRSYTRKAA